MRMFLFVLFSSLAVALGCPRAWAQNDTPYQSESGSWAFTKPGSWNPIGFTVMRDVENQNRQKYPDKNFKYVAGFTRGGMNTFNEPFIFVNITQADLSGLSYGDLERGLAIVKPKSKREAMLVDAVRQFTWGETVVDADHNRTVSTFHIPNGRKGPSTLTIYSFLGSHNVVQFECYDLDANGSKNQAYINEIVSTFHFSDGNAFVPTAGVSKASDNSNNRIVAMFLLGIIGGLIVLAVAIKLIAGAMSKG